MQRATALFQEQQRSQIESAVAEAESKTACEIVPVVATASGRYDRAEDVVGLWLAVVVAVCVWWLFPQASSEEGSWGGASTAAGIATMVVAMVLAFVVGASLASNLAWLRRLFVPRIQMREEVSTKARQIFFDQRVHHTVGASGLLVYVSLFERMAVVLGDQQVVEKLGHGALDRFCQQLTGGLLEGDATAALCGTIRSAGGQLAAVLPRETSDIDELQNVLVLLD